ncbi:MAG: DUF2752 domain-containing protein [Phycisphaerales bacterium]|jgi:hypothetical protein|nr:DUF2752 domain-containing protein [Phycisphaerales bacterium]
MESEENLNELRMPVKSERSRRLHALGLAISLIAILCVAFFLSPSSKGVGTHQQLGLPSCGWILAADVPCPTCGMTTAWAYTVRGDLISAFEAQPMGMITAIIAVIVAIAALGTLIFGYSYQALFYRFPPSKIIILVIVVSLLSWVYKILVHRGIL